MLSISNPGRFVRLTILLPAVLNAFTLERIIPASTSYIAPSFGLNPSGLLPIASSFFLDFAVTSLKLCSSFLDACGASISDLALRFALGFGFCFYLRWIFDVLVFLLKLCYFFIVGILIYEALH